MLVLLNASKYQSFCFEINASPSQLSTSPSSPELTFQLQIPIPLNGQQLNYRLNLHFNSRSQSLQTLNSFNQLQIPIPLKPESRLSRKLLFKILFTIPYYKPELPLYHFSTPGLDPNHSNPEQFYFNTHFPSPSRSRVSFLYNTSPISVK